MQYSKIGFHMSSTGNRNGWGDFVRSLDAADLPAVCASVGGEGIGDIVARWDAGSTVPHVGVIRYMGNGQDVPHYDKSPQAAVDAWLAWYVPLAKQNPQLIKYRTWLITKHGNELNKHNIDWLCDFYTLLQPAFCEAMGWTDHNHAICCFSFAAGEPEPEAWERLRVLEFLRHVAANPERFVIGLHEYSYNMGPLAASYPHHVGRFERLYQTCDQQGIARPRVFAHEFGWTHTNVPTPPDMTSIAWAAGLYAKYKEHLGAALWTTQDWQGSGIQNKVQQYMTPIRDYTLATVFPDPTPPPDPQPEPEPGDCRGLPREPYRREYHVVPATLPEPRRVELYTAAAKSNTTIGPSYDDAGIGDLEDKTAVLWDLPPEEHQEFRDWFAQYYPGTVVEFMPANNPLPPAFAFTHWPTVDRTVTQEFGANPQNYVQFGLPGHEGVDIRAATGSPIYAVADGVVHVIHPADDGHNYGIHVRLNHADGSHQTIYAHLQSIAAGLVVGTAVAGGQQIGKADNTGNSFGSHLHLTYKRPGLAFVDPAGNEWPSNIHNPTALLAALPGVTWPGGSPGIPGSEINPPLNPPDPEPEPQPPPYQYNGRAVTFAPSLHSPADDWRWPTVNSLIAGLGVGVKFLSHGVNADWVGGYAGRFRMCRLFWNNPAGDSKKTPQQKWDQDWKSDFARMYNAGIRIFEIHNEPRLNSEGMGHQWNNAQEWGAWLSGMVDIIRAQYPQALLYYPGESPGVPWTDQFSFTNVAWPMVRDKMQGFCMHSYSGSAVFNTAVDEIVSQVVGLQAYLNLQVPLIVSEASVNRGTDYWMKASTYVEVEKRLRTMPGVEGVAWYISDWYNPPPEQAGHGESWYGTALPAHYDQLN